MKGTGRTAGLSSDAGARRAATPTSPTPLVPRELIRPVTERIDVDGDVVVPLDEDGVRRAVRELVDAGVEALTISFLWSTVNPAHEQRAREIALRGRARPVRVVRLGPVARRSASTSARRPRS